MTVQVYYDARKKTPSRFLKHAHEEKLIVLQTAFMPDVGLCVTRGRHCACRDKLVVWGRTVTVSEGEHVVNSFPYYQLPVDATPEEELTLVTWWTRHRFSSFGHEIQPYERCKTMTRFLTSNSIFRCRPHPDCEQCRVYDMVKEPVFCLKSIVLSQQNKGPTIESALTCRCNDNFDTPRNMPKP